MFTDDQLVSLYTFIRANEHTPAMQQQCRLARFALGNGLREIEIVHQAKGTTIVDRNDQITAHVAAEWSKNHKPRETPCTPELAPFLRSWLEEMEEGEYLFHKSNGEPYTTRHLQRWWNELCAAAGLPNLAGMHGTRHTWATEELRSKRLDILQVSKFLGHVRIEITMNYYGHAVAESAYSTEPPKWWSVALCQDKPALRIAG
ncbi:MAG: site-specific integrase [Actinomycetota bacterium]